ncbi:multicopper oxidase family protein [Paenibacillus turpanensis]|uniref:multicopper oxidase family protein n=1 Tax=Paenibacillus turpanensis TaxID=2689078 RepID=UPI00140D61C7|nr:multicopper oxidase family protein [Paenibacillus turpanensis]
MVRKCVNRFLDKMEAIKRKVTRWFGIFLLITVTFIVIILLLILTWALRQLAPPSAYSAQPPAAAATQIDRQVQSGQNNEGQSAPQTRTHPPTSMSGNETELDGSTAEANSQVEKPLPEDLLGTAQKLSQDSTADLQDSPLLGERTLAERTITDDGTIEFRLSAAPETVNISPTLPFEAWTYNGMLPGPIIRVTEGERVRIVFENHVPGIGTAVHWHGIPTRNEVDGVPELTQPSVNTGESYVYEFTASPSGTYSYHAHGANKGAEQLDRGLYGPFIIDPAEPTWLPKASVEWILSVDEMQIPGAGSAPPASDGNLMDQEMMQRMMPRAILGSADVYNVFIINGKRSPQQPLVARAGEWIRIRLLNFGYQKHRFTIDGLKLFATHMDGRALPAAQPVEILEIAPYERLDAYIYGMTPGTYTLKDIDPGHSESGMKAKIRLQPPKGPNQTEDMDNLKNTPSATGSPLPIPRIKTADIPEGAPRYQQVAAGVPGPDNTTYDRIYNMTLGMTMDDGQMAWAINGRSWDSFEDTEPYLLKKGEKVRINLTNMSPESHPMHLHGHLFHIVEINGQPIAEPWLLKDTINLRPMDRISIAFTADNPGDWFFHCHQELHADHGLKTYFTYEKIETRNKDAGGTPADR